MSEKPAAALPKEEAPRCDECKRPKLTWTTLPEACVGPESHCARELVPRDGDLAAACHRIARDLSRAAHQKTLDALEAALLASRTKLRQQQGVKAAFSGLAASAASILAAGGRNV